MDESGCISSAPDSGVEHLTVQFRTESTITREPILAASEQGPGVLSDEWLDEVVSALEYLQRVQLDRRVGSLVNSGTTGQLIFAESSD